MERFLKAPMILWRLIDARVDGALAFFFKHYGKSRFMVAMSKKVQILGVEKLWRQSSKAFIYFFPFLPRAGHHLVISLSPSTPEQIVQEDRF